MAALGGFYRAWIVGFALTLASCAASQGSLAGASVAVTVDDLPGFVRADGMSRQEQVDRIIAALRSNGVPGAHGFVTEAARAGIPEDDGVLRDWLAAGYDLGNHTFSHRHLNGMSAMDFIANIVRQDTALGQSGLRASHRMFRYPFLDEGDTLEKRDAVRAYLASAGYTVAQVTVQYDDWAWTSAYTRCLGARDQDGIAWLHHHVGKAADARLRESRALARRVVGHDIPHILLIHPSAFTALSLAPILSRWREQGVTFVSLEQALADPTYRINPNVPDECAECSGQHGRPFLHQIARAHTIDVASLQNTSYAPERLGAICTVAARLG